MLAFEHRLKFNVAAPLFMACIFRFFIIRLLLLRLNKKHLAQSA